MLAVVDAHFLQPIGLVEARDATLDAAVRDRRDLMAKSLSYARTAYIDFFGVASTRSTMGTNVSSGRHARFPSNAGLS